MSPTTRRGLALIVSMLCFDMTGVAFGQQGASSAAASRTRYLGEMGVIPSSREVAVEEFVNYHRHQIGLPTSDQAVNMDVRWGNNVVSGSGRQAVLQVGFSTALQNDRQHLRPINLALVIDKSGSMADYDKLSRVKTSLLALVSRLRETDVLSIVIFDDEAEVLMPARTLEDKDEVKQLIRRIEPGGSTNLNAGLMLGYREALKHFRKNATNRVILLTDGIANRGVTDPKSIAEASSSFNDKGIDLSTIGVGLDLNKDLLRELATSGRGLFHFVADNEDVEKVFVNELQSLLSPVAAEPNLEIEYGSGLELEQLYGYQPKIRHHKVTLKLENMNSGLTEVVLLRFTATSDDLERSRLPVKVRLTYYDLERKEEVVKTQEIFLTVREGSPQEMLKDEEVGKNYTIALLAQSIRDMAAACEGGRYRTAENLVNSAIASTCRRYPHLEDEDIKRTLLIAQKYQDVLKKRNRLDDSRGDGDGR
ncbi:MAG: VWA domain-containing protein [Fimbriimonadales bacterium]